MNWQVSIKSKQPWRVLRTFRSWLSQKWISRELARFQFSALPSSMHLASDEAVQRKLPVVDANLGPGVNIYGYLNGEFGLGETSRRYSEALLDVGYPVALINAGIDIPHSCGDHRLSALVTDTSAYLVNIVFVNPDHFLDVLPKLQPGSYTIGFWFWELDVIPDGWLEALDRVDEVWVATEFIEKAFRQVTEKPVVRIPHPISIAATAEVSRADFDLVADAFVFLCTFDFNSSIHRKNPYAVLDAFKLAFPEGTENVQLVLKSSNGHRHVHELRKLHRYAKGDGRVLIRDQVLNVKQLRALQQTADAYVSLHRAEGLGLGLAECMAMGKPVIGTAWSGNLDFMSEENSCLVPCRLVPIQQGQYPHARGGVWAEVDVAVAANWMRCLASSPEVVAEKGAAARMAVAGSMSSAGAAEAMIARLRSLRSV